MSRAHGSSGQTPSGHQGGAAHPLNWNPAESNPDQLMRDEILGMFIHDSANLQR